MALFKTTTVKENKREKGIALIFTLIMLSLLLILALSFALDSMFEQKAAYNSASASSAELMTQSQLQEVLSLVQNESANLSKTTWSWDGSSTASTQTDYLNNVQDYHTDQLKDLLEVAGLLDDKTNSTAWGTGGVNWNYIKDPADNNRIIGRTAFVIIPDEKIPLPSLIDARVGTTDYPSQNEQNDTETRIGKYVSEINVRNAIPNTVAAHTTVETDTLALVLNWKQNLTTGAGFAGGEYEGSWGSYDNLFDSITSAPNKVNNFSSADKDEFQTNLTISRTEEAEAFWMDINKNEEVDDGELYRRFNLTRNDWDKSTWAEDLEFMREQILMLKKDDASTVPCYALQEWDESDGTTFTRGLPWLAFFGYNPSGAPSNSLRKTFPSLFARRCQIAANLKDYCDSDSRPTSDKNPANWLTEEPSFTGNEKTPYIDKIGVSIATTRGNQGTGSFADAKASLVVKPWVGLVNIYDSDFITSNLKVKIKGYVTATATGSGTSDPITIPFDEEIDFSGWSGAKNSYSDLAAGAYADGSTEYVACGETAVFKVNVTDVVIEKVVLYDGTFTGTYSAYDYTKQLLKVSLDPAFSSASQVTQTSWYGWAVHDPRQNLNKKDWLELSPAIGDAPDVLSVTGTGPYAGYANSQNASGRPTENPQNGDSISTAPADPKFTGDQETSSDPVDLSTAHIRNKPMESPWELGFIHRAYKWHTINLKSYEYSIAYTPMATKVNGYNYLSGGYTYLIGDANILDQIKMTDNATSPQKINLNSKNLITFKALLGMLKYGCDIDSDMSIYSMSGIGDATASPAIPVSGTLLPRGDAITDGIAQNLLDKYDPVKTAVPRAQRLTRASIVDKLRLPMTVNSTTIPGGNVSDAEQEELIGKVVNLTKIGNQSGHFTIVVLAQTIKDVGGIGTPIPITKYPVDGSAVTQDCTIGTFDVKINDVNNPDKNIYFDEITATKKIIFKGRTIGAGKIKILGQEYAN